MVCKRNINILHGGIVVILCLILASLPLLFHARIVHFTCIVGFLLMFLQFFSEKVIIVRFEEFIKIVARFHRVFKDLPLMVVDVGQILLPICFILSMLSFDSFFLLLHCELFVSDVIFFASMNLVCKVRMLVCNHNLLLKTVFF